jgi:Na+/H+ antiporter NhaD/arsenite permease-like protein
MSAAFFVVFGITLLSIAVFHKRSLECAAAGLTALIVLSYLQGGFSLLHHITGDSTHEGEWKILVNLFGLLTGFEILSKYFSDSGLPLLVAKFLPDGWKGGFILLLFVFILSAFLDNIAAAMIGGAMAIVVFDRKIHPGYIIAIVAAANAGGAGSVLGDTTTTMMWISGIPALNVFRAYIACGAAFIFFAIIASHQQSRLQHTVVNIDQPVKVDSERMVIVVLMLIATAAANILIDFAAAGLWLAIIATSFLKKIPVKEFKDSLRGTFFLLALVLSASLLPVHELPAPTMLTTFLLGTLSSVFDNIPLTRLAIAQRNYDWGMLAYAVGFGGSMVWFGSSAGVAITNLFPESRSVLSWLKNGWHVAIAYLIGFFSQLLFLGWKP